jgi:hypothetical protein
MGEALREHFCDSLRHRFLELNKLFNKMRDCVPHADINPVKANNTQSSQLIRSTISRLEAFKRVVPQEYESLFMRAFIDLAERRRMIQVLSGHVSAIVLRLQQFLDPKVSIAAATKMLMDAEGRLRNVITDFPEQQRVGGKSKISKSESEKRQIRVLEHRALDLKMRSEAIEEELAIIAQSHQFTVEEIEAEKANWKAERAELRQILQGKVENSELEGLLLDLERLKEETCRLSAEVEANKPAINIDEIKREIRHLQAELTLKEKEFKESADKVIQARAEAALYLSIAGDSGVLRQNYDSFIKKEQLAIAVNTLKMKELHLQELSLRRSKPPHADPDVRVNDARNACRENLELLDGIDSRITTVQTLTVDTIQRKFDNYQRAAQPSHVERLKERISRKVGDSPPKFEKNHELLAVDFELQLLRFQRDPDPEAELNWHQDFENHCAQLKADVKQGSRERVIRSAALTAVIQGSTGDYKNEKRAQERIFRNQQDWIRGLETVLGLSVDTDQSIEDRFDNMKAQLDQIDEMAIEDRIRFMRKQVVTIGRANCDLEKRLNTK